MSLIQELRNNVVDRFQRRKIQSLQEYLAENGYLTEGDPLPLEAIRDQARSRMQRHVESGRIGRDRLDCLLDVVLASMRNGDVSARPNQPWRAW
jgi:hypothetical protein